MIPDEATKVLSANLPSRSDRAFKLSFIHSLAPPFLSLVVVLSDAVVDTIGPPSRASIKTPIAIPTAVNIDTIITPCSLTLSLAGYF